MSKIDHPCVTYNEVNEPVLRIFNCMFEEKTLPKFQKAMENLDEMSRKDFESLDDSMAITAAYGTNELKGSDKYSYGKHLQQIEDYFKKRYSFWNKVKSLLKGTISPDKSFEETKKSFKELEITPEYEKELLAKFDAMLEQAKKSSQATLVELVTKNKDILLKEITLAKNGFNKIITEGQVINFIGKSEKGVRLDFIRTYSRVIPKSIVDIKIKADALNIFDNYCVLHYDPLLTAMRKEVTTESNRSAVKTARDPILFGMIKGSRKLYFVGDWVTDEDDLTLDKLLQEVDNPFKRQLTLAEEFEEAFSSFGEVGDFSVVSNDSEGK